jgi:hypothetical protein
MFSQHANGVKVVVASRQRETELFNIGKNYVYRSAKTVKKIQENKAQLSLFDF